MAAKLIAKCVGGVHYVDVKFLGGTLMLRLSREGVKVWFDSWYQSPR